MKISTLAQTFSQESFIQRRRERAVPSCRGLRQCAVHALVNPFKQAHGQRGKLQPPEVGFKPYVGAALSVTAILIAQAQMSGSVQAELKALNGRFDQVDKQLREVSKDVGELKQQVSFLNGYLAGNAKGPIPSFSSSEPEASPSR